MSISRVLAMAVRIWMKMRMLLRKNENENVIKGENAVWQWLQKARTYSPVAIEMKKKTHSKLMTTQGHYNKIWSIFIYI